MLRLVTLWATLFVFLRLQPSLEAAKGEMLGKLLQFGYLKERVGNSRNEPPTPEEITESLIKFQKFNGLKETGVYDKPTRKLLNTRRCGNKDIFNENDTSGPNSYNAVKRWDKKEITWALVKFSETQRLSHEDQLRAIQKGLEYWSNVTQLTFKKVSGIADILISFERNRHGDNSPFDGPSGVLAHAFFPGNMELNGDTHFDDAELWTQYTDEGTNLEIVAAHEFGHALGLGHSTVAKALMAPYYRGYIPNFQLHPDDIAGIQQLYGLRQTTVPSTTVTEPTTTEVPTTTEPTTTEVPTTQKLTTTMQPTTQEVTTQKLTTSKQLPINLCNRPPNSKIQAAFTDSKGVIYIFLNTGHVISNVTGIHKIDDFFPKGPQYVDAAAYSDAHKMLFLLRGNYMWMYTLDASGNTFSPAETFMKKLEIEVDAATVILDKYGWERIFLFKGQYMYEYHQYFMSLFGRLQVEQMWYGVPSVYDAIVTNEKEINFLHGDSYTTLNRQHNVVVNVPRPIDVLFECA